MLTRRRLLALTAAGITFVPGIRLALASAPIESRVVVIVLRGAMDGLAAVPAYGDKDYAEARGNLAFASPGQENGCLDLDGHFGLNPALADLMPLWKSGEFAVLHAAATPYRARSHFDGQDMLETGGAQHALADGWLNRALAAMDGGGRALGLAVGPEEPLILRGPAKIASWSPEQLLPPVSGDFLERLSDLYRGDSLLAPALAEGMQAEMVSDEVMGPNATSSKVIKGAEYLPDAAGGAGKLLADPRGPRIAVLDAGGWDTHTGQGMQTGRLATALKGLAASLVALKNSMQPVWRNTTILVATEFGRTVAPNGTGGTDHGTGTAAFLLGGSVAGGRVITKWPGLSANRLYQNRDLAATTDLRSVFKTVCQRQLGLDAATVEKKVFPDSVDSPLMSDLLRA
jgi:uncharacterized protein (DUF1501 family)